MWVKSYLKSGIQDFNTKVDSKNQGKEEKKYCEERKQ